MNSSDPHIPGDTPAAAPADAPAELHAPDVLDAAPVEGVQDGLPESASVAPVKEAQGLPTTLTAAQDAAVFVARIFADTPAQKAENTDVLEPASAVDVNAVVDGTPALAEALSDTPLQPLLGQNILILGLGASGLAMARWCVRTGAAQVTVADTRDAPPQLTTLQQELAQVRFIAGAFDADLVGGKDLHAVYRSPGLSPEQIAPVLLAASAHSMRVGGELDLYALALLALRSQRAYAPAVLAITGTNGKTTVTALTGQLLAHAGKTVAVAGNIGPSLLDTLSGHLDANTLPEVWVLELSSFQLDGVVGFEPTAAAVLNVSQDHLDWHGSMPAYAAAKARIFGQQALMVLNRDDAGVMAMLSGAGPSQGAKAPLGGSAARAAASVGATHPAPVRLKLQRPQQRAHITFGTDMPQRPGDFGMEEVNGMVWMVRALEADETRKKRRDTVEELHIQRLMPAEVLRIRGRHNASNALAALALCSATGCALAPILFGLREYRGEPHRVESVGILNGVEFFDDSKGTNVGATVAALQGLGADRKLVLILGGEGKGQDFAPLAVPVSRFCRAVVLIGRDAPVIEAALLDSGVPLIHAASMDEAVAQANQRAHAGDAVVMSPACASFDMFDNYAHRAQVFCTAVQDLALASGTQLETLA